MDSRRSTFAGISLPSPKNRRLGWGSAAIILLYGATLLSIGLTGASRVLTYHETLFAVPAREMMERHDYVVPHFVGQPSYHKPPLTYWLTAASMWLFSSEAEWVVRLPAVGAGILASLVIAAFAARWWGERAGLIAGLVQLTTFYSQMQSRLAESDMFLCAAVSSAMYFYARAAIDRPHGRFVQHALAVLFHVSCGCAFLSKGPVGLAFIFGGIALYHALARQWPGAFPLFDPIGLPTLIVMVACWPIIAYAQDPGIMEQWLVHNVGRFLGQMDGRQHPLFYLGMAPLLLLPWTPTAVVSLWPNKEKDRSLEKQHWLLMAWFLFGLAFLTVSVWKHKHYIIPVMPPLSVAAALGLERILFSPNRRPWPMAIFGVALAVIGVATLMGTRIKAPDLTPAATLILGAGSAGLWCSAYFGNRRQTSAQLATLFATVWLVSGIFEITTMPFFDSYRDQTELARRINESAPAHEPIVLVELPESQICYYLREPMERIDPMEQLAPRLRSRASREWLVIGPARAVDHLAELGAVEVLDQCATIRGRLPESERMTFFRVVPLVVDRSNASEFLR